MGIIDSICPLLPELPVVEVEVVEIICSFFCTKVGTQVTVIFNFKGLSWQTKDLPYYIMKINEGGCTGRNR
ncbi:hypothetical protein PAXRUDRAFT_269254 [Paxillus rubicundulus Ve08.2h10]|uniref:Uncharacterized protein n=1 Tax=Paxillus rubicundulus Ve08.2h10 TaxID=930991 RepID=A0A0D0DMJ3_9AGAM|nr:hypothetical protein PAXRUDRAFT_269254 [Paxillus rubicundulus Ve08.2h10]